MSFEHPFRLLGLLLLLPLAFLEWRALRRADRAVKLLLGVRPLPGLLLQLVPKQRVIALALRLAAVALLALGAAGPQWGREAVRRQSQGSDVVFVIDVSTSMETRDVPPSRMEEARREAVALLGHLAGSRVGVVAFAGDAVRLCPLTLDQAAVRLTLETIGPGAVSEPGSDLGRALRAGLKLLPAARRAEQAMVVWTDGEDLEGHAREALAEVRNAGLRVLTVGVGTPAGDVIPIQDVAGVTVDTKRDERGNVVRSRLDESLLREIARATRGLYFAGSRSGGELVRLASALGSLARSRQGTRLVERPVARFPLCALLASTALVVFLVSPRRRIVRRSAPLERPRSKRAASRPAAGGKAPEAKLAPAPPASPGKPATTAPTAAAAALVLFVLLPATAHGQSAWASGDAAFRKGEWARAESLYARRARSPRPPAALLANLAAARAQRAPDDSVERQLSHLAARQDRAGAMSGYNLGTLLGRRGEVNHALAELRRAIERDPNDADARWNYEWLRRQQDDESSQSPKPDASKPNDKQPQKPQDSKAGQGSAQSTQPPPSSSQSSPQAQAPPAPGMQQPMTRRQAEELLGSLGDLERSEQRGRRREGTPREKRGKDW